MVNKTADVRIPLPPVEDWEYKDQNIQPVTIDIEEDLDITVTTVLDPPSQFSVVSMTPRITPDGKTLMDLVFEVQAVPFADSYEVRVS